MDLERLVRGLADPRAYPHPAMDVEVHHTHISVVFLAGPYAYKLKKPLDLGFLDFTTPERRRQSCLDEVRLNSRLAPGVYLGVVPVVAEGGRVRVGEPPLQPEPAMRGGDVADGPGTGDRAAGAGDDERGPSESAPGGHRSPRAARGGGAAPGAAPGEREPVVDWMVWMERLPEEATLESRLRQERVGPGLLQALAVRLAEFHAGAEAGEHVARFARWDVVARNCRENFEQSAGHAGLTVDPAVRDRVRELTEACLDRLRPVIERRAAAGVARDTHGDLRLEHVYVLADRPAPRDLIVVDCIEFNERFRYADPVADAAFLAMDLAFHGRRDLARAFEEAYLGAAGDREGRVLRPFYVAYRSVVRAKVEGFAALESEVPEEERSRALRRARAHWLLALGELEEPGARPALVLVAGLPGTGKSTLARALARVAEFQVLGSDAVRKSLAGLEPGTATAAPFGEGLYTPEWDDRTYAELLRRAHELLLRGERVVVDASFREEGRRGAFLEAARRLGIRVLLLCCRADPEVARSRLAQRRGDASDADVEVYRQAAARWEPFGARTLRAAHDVPSGDAPGSVVSRALEILRDAELA